GKCWGSTSPFECRCYRSLAQSMLPNVTAFAKEAPEMSSLVANSYNLRVPICAGILTCRQTGSFNSGQVKAVAEEFHKDYGFGRSCEKFRKGIAEGNGDDLFRRGQSGPNGTNPGAE